MNEVPATALGADGPIGVVLRTTQSYNHASTDAGWSSPVARRAHVCLLGAPTLKAKAKAKAKTPELGSRQAKPDKTGPAGRCRPWPPPHPSLVFAAAVTNATSPPLIGNCRAEAPKVKSGRFGSGRRLEPAKSDTMTTDACRLPARRSH